MKMKAPKLTLRMIADLGVLYPLMLMGCGGGVAYVLPHSEWWHVPIGMFVMLALYITNMHMKWYLLNASEDN